MATFKTKTGPIYYDSTGNDHRPNIVDSRPRWRKRHEAVKLQRAALRSFREAERLLGRRLGKGRWSLRKSRAIDVTGSWRSFDLQAALFATNGVGDNPPNRYASPFTSGHVQGVAIDVSTAFAHFDLAIAILESLGWQRSRPDDESWHLTYGVRV